MRPLTSWSVLRCAKALTASGGYRRQDRGQVAVMFIVLIGLILVLAASTMNLGEAAKLKTSTANAADGGALAAASWVASGENEASVISEALWINYIVLTVIFLLPFCWSYCFWLPLLVWLVYMLLQQQLLDAANDTMSEAWKIAHSAAVITATQNATIDDPTGVVNAKLQTLSGGEIPENPFTLSWTRTGADGVARNSSLTIDLAMDPKPKLTLTLWSPFPACWSPPIGYCSWSTIGWGYFCCIFDSIPVMITSCSTCFGFPLPPIPSGHGHPDDIKNGNGSVTVTVTHHRDSGGTLRFWVMKYPAAIVSQAQAAYNKSNIRLTGSRGGSIAKLTGIL